jgi:RNA polymerase sigma-70 factor, ECF subfamily
MQSIDARLPSEFVLRARLQTGPKSGTVRCSYRLGAIWVIKTLPYWKSGENMQRDEQLMLAFQKGSTESFSELFLRYRDPLFGFFRRRLSDPTRAEELTQECFLAVLQGAERWEPRATFRTYLYSIALKLTAAEYHRSQREPRQTTEADEVGQRIATEADLGVRRAIAALDAEHREVVLLREYEGLSHEEIAVALRIPVNTVRSRLFRARTSLKELLDPQPQKLHRAKEVSSTQAPAIQELRQEP